MGFTRLVVVGALLGLAAGAWALPADLKCQTQKLKAAGKYFACRMKAESKAVKKGLPPDFSKCDEQYAKKWQKAEAKAGAGVCPSEGDELVVQGDLESGADSAALKIAGLGCLGFEYSGACWFLGADSASCDVTCAAEGRVYDPATRSVAGDTGSLVACFAVLDGLGQTSPPLTDAGDAACGVGGIGCVVASGSRGRCVDTATDGPSATASASRACACQ